MQSGVYSVCSRAFEMGISTVRPCLPKWNATIEWAKFFLWVNVESVKTTLWSFWPAQGFSWEIMFGVLGPNLTCRSSFTLAAALVPLRPRVRAHRIAEARYHAAERFFSEESWLCGRVQNVLTDKPKHSHLDLAYLGRKATACGLAFMGSGRPDFTLITMLLGKKRFIYCLRITAYRKEQRSGVHAILQRAPFFSCK